MIKILVKNRLLGVFGSMLGKRGKGGEIKKASKLKIALFALLYLYVAIVFLGITVSMSYTLASFFLPSTGWFYYLMLMLLSLTLIFIFSIFETKSEIFECKDNDLLLSMPIRPHDIVAARVSVVLVYNYLIEALIMVPAIIFYAVFTSDVFGIIGGILISALVPLLGTALASAVGYLVAEISRKMKNKNFIVVLLSMLFLGIYMFAYSYALDNAERILENLLGITDAILNNYKILVFIGKAGLLSPLPIISLALICIGAFLLSYYIISSRYIKIVTAETGTKKNVYKEKKYRTGTPIGALVIKDIRKFFSSSGYILNGGLGLVFCVALSVMLLFQRELLVALTDGFGVSAGVTAVLAVFVIVLVSSMTLVAACSLSLEGKSLWIIKSAPISARTVLNAKALSQFIISAAPLFISSVFIIIAARPAPIWWLLIIIIPQFASMAFSYMQVTFNVLFPKYEFENEVQVIKQSLSTFVSMISGMLIGIAVMVGAIFAAVISEILYAVYSLGIYLIIACIFYAIVNGPCVRKFRSH